MEDISSPQQQAIPDKELLESSPTKEQVSNTDLEKIELSNIQTENKTEGISTKGSEIFEDRMEPKPSETPPLLLLDTKSARMEDDSVFSGDLSTMPDQILAESPKHDDMDTSTENEIASNIEEQLKEFDGSDDDNSFGGQVKEDAPAVTKEISQPIDMFEIDASDDDSQSKMEKMKSSMEVQEPETFPIVKQKIAEEHQKEVLTVLSENEEDEQKQSEVKPALVDSKMKVDEKFDDVSMEQNSSDTPIHNYELKDEEKDVSMESKDEDDIPSNVESSDIEMENDNSTSCDIKTISKTDNTQDEVKKSQTITAEEQEATENEDNIIKATMEKLDSPITAIEEDILPEKEPELEKKTKDEDGDVEQIDESNDFSLDSDNEVQEVLLTISTGKKEEKQFKNTIDDNDVNETCQSTPSEIAAEDDQMEEEVDNEPRNLDLNELEIKELDADVKDEKCFKCRKAKNCRYRFMMFSEEKYLCDIKCVNAFRTTSKEPYVLVARKCIITSFLGSVQSCMRCKTKRTCMYRFKDTDTGVFSYLCTSACINAYIGKNIEKYVVRRRKYIVEEIQERKEKCEHCGEIKSCKYAFRSDHLYLFLCNEDCFNAMSKDDPDRYRLKPIRSVRLRDSSAQPTVNEDTKVVPRTNEDVEAAKEERDACLHRNCAQCLESITLSDQTLYWETLDFCNDKCLTKYQTTVNSKCKFCNNIVRMPNLIKFCVRFGFDVMQFCCSTCLEQFKKTFKVCFFCQQDISKSDDVLIAPVGEKGQLKDFCSQLCLHNLDEICNPKKMYQTCSVCSNEKIVRIEFKLNQREYKFCSNPCFSAFKFVNNFLPDQCTTCQKYFERKKAENYTLYWDKTPKMFCCKICMTIYLNLNRKIVPCEWCKVKKYNLDMIQKQKNSQSIMLCSLNCLTVYGVSPNKISITETKCMNCNRVTKPQYQLSMSDATLRLFCSFQCAMVHGNRVATMNRKGSTLHCLGPPSRVKTKPQESLPPAEESTTDNTILPVLTNVSAIAASPGPASSPESVVMKPLRKGRARLVTIKSEQTGGGGTVQSSSPIPLGETSEDDQPLGRLRSLRSAGAVQNTQSRAISPSLTKIITTNSHTQTKQVTKKSIGVSVTSGKISEDEQSEISGKPIVANKKSIDDLKLDVLSPGEKIEQKTRVITVPQRPPRVANKQTMCKPLTLSKKEMCNVECQTDNDLTKNVLIPIPVPIYVPQPMYMYSAPFPVPIPFPLPIPVPIFIPTTRNSAEGIMKEIKKIQDKMPTDPYEAELLMMAEMVADDKKKGDSDSECEQEPVQRPQEYEEVEVAEPANSFGEDVLQMALKMATECDETSAVDLETAMTTSTITPTVPAPHISQDDFDDSSEMQNKMIMIDGQRQIIRGKKRSGSPIAGSTISGSTKNNRLVPVPVKKKPRTAEPPAIEQVERDGDDTPTKPDANMCLKYTFGVNAWKQWVMTKNADIEKSSFKRKPFKSELLQLTADELNYSLCLFVKEVRKPNGSEYAPDTIFYLVLGIQQYLFVNGRIENIFTDTYYERFTDCLDEVAKKFSILYNDSQYIVTRVEEEHLWECKQLGAHSPHVLLSTLMFFNTKHFNLTTVEEHMQLSFSHIMKHWKRSAPVTKPANARNVLLRFYPPQSGLDANPRKKKVYEQQENENNPLRCPVKLYEFYLSKCPESVKTRNDVFYLQPERSCVPDSPVWYSTQPLGREALSKMLHRVKMVKEINIALITS